MEFGRNELIPCVISLRSFLSRRSTGRARQRRAGWERTGCHKSVARSLQETLASIADVLYPEDFEIRRVSIDSVGYDGDTPLHVMAWRNDLEAVEILLGAGADANAKGEMDETPLHVAITQKNPAMVGAMLKAGARDDIRCEFGDTPRERAIEQGEPLSSLFRTTGDV